MPTCYIHQSGPAIRKEVMPSSTWRNSRMGHVHAVRVLACDMILESVLNMKGHVSS